MRFAHLSLNGGAVLIDPALVGVVMKDTTDGVPVSQRKTMILQRNDAVTALMVVDEEPEEAGRRIVAAAGGATVADVDEAFKEFTMEIVALLQNRGSVLYAGPQYAVDAIRDRMCMAFRKLKETVLKAACVAEGKETE
jgi:hypothetical protein